MITSDILRQKTIEFSCLHNAGHLAPSLSSVEILTSVFKFMNFDPANPQDSTRDRLVLSKGHGCYAYYCALNLLGILPDSELDSFGSSNSKLKGCVSFAPEYMIEASTGSLGHGLPLAVGMAQSFKMQGLGNKVICIAGDGEMGEGSCFEALNLAYRFKLDNLLVIIDANGLCAMDFMEKVGLDTNRLAKVLSSYTSSFYDLDGHCEKSLDSMMQEFFSYQKSEFSICIARTIKGKGVEMIENIPKYHYRCPTQDGYIYKRRKA